MSNFSRKRIAPIETASDIIEIRPSRYLRIQHHNARPRDEQFDREMGIFMQYKKRGIPSSGPLTMSKRFTGKITSQSSKLNQRNASVNASHVNTENDSSVEKAICSKDLVKEELSSSAIPEDDIPTSLVNPSVSSSVLSSPTHTKNSNKIQSASSVLVALHNMPKQENQNEPHKSVTSVSKSSSPLFQKTAQKQSDDDQQISISDTKKTPKEENVNAACQSEPDKCKSLNGLSNKGNVSVDSDTVLFFIHGVGGSSDVWCAQILYFAQRGHEVIAPDLIGHGFSCCPKNSKAYHFKEIAADMEELFDKYCKRKNVVVGHSYGGAFYKKRKPEISKKDAFSVPTNVLQHMMNGQIWPDGDEIYHNWLTCECLLIYGAEDQLVSLQDELDTQRAIFNSQLEVVKEASHMVMMEAPNEVNHLLSNFIDQTLNYQNQDSPRNNVTESVTIASSFRRQRSSISLKSHVPKKSESQT